MYKPRILFKNIIKGQKYGFLSYSTKNGLKFSKCLLVCKLSRYEFQRNRLRMLNRENLERELRGRGIDYEKMLHYHELHKAFHAKVAKTLKEMDIQVRVVNRLSFQEEDVDWADVIIPSGGDGTFLLAASKVLDNNKPVIGFNSDPTRSEGHLCLPKRYTTDIKGAVQRLLAGDFKWLMRSRIRTTILNQKGDQSATHLHECGDYEAQRQINTTDFNKQGIVLPYLALNEVFIGETMSARVSHLEMRVDQVKESTSMKCSGLCVSTGTGSTSWCLSINRLSPQTVLDPLTNAGDCTGAATRDHTHTQGRYYTLCIITGTLVTTLALILVSGRLVQSNVVSNVFRCFQVFIGETMSARVSHLEMRVDQEKEPTSMKCSGLCVSTGTGSTSWCLSINRLSPQTVLDLLNIAEDCDGTKIGREEKERRDLAEKVCDLYNRKLVFDPALPVMGYTVRDLVCGAVWPRGRKKCGPRGEASRLSITSRCLDANLVIDGGACYAFNDSTTAILEILPTDALRTVILPE